MADGSHIPHGFIHGSPYPMNFSMGGITPNPQRDILEKNQLYNQSTASGTLASN
jgi:hypothetical protein